MNKYLLLIETQTINRTSGIMDKTRSNMILCVSDSDDDFLIQWEKYVNTLKTATYNNGGECTSCLIINCCKL